MPKRTMTFRQRGAKRSMPYRRKDAGVYRKYRPRATSLRNARTGGFLGLELKFLDCAWDDVTIPTVTAGADGLELQPSTGCTNAISVPAQGDGESNRDGRKYVIKSAWFSGMVQTVPLASQSTITENAGYYFAMVLDTQVNGATINSEDVYTNPSTQPAALLPTPLRDLQNSKRFRILAAKYVAPRDTVTAGSSVFNVAPAVNQTVNLSWKGSIDVNCTGTTADIASVSDNAISIIAMAGTGNFTPTIRAKSRVRFMG